MDFGKLSSQDRVSKQSRCVRRCTTKQRVGSTQIWTDLVFTLSCPVCSLYTVLFNTQTTWVGLCHIWWLGKDFTIVQSFRMNKRMNTKVLWNQMKVVVVDNFTILNPTSSKSLQNWCFTFLSGKFLVKFQIQFVCLKDGVHLYSFPFQSKHVHFSDTKLGNVTIVDSLKTDTFWNLESLFWGQMKISK